MYKVTGLEALFSSQEKSRKGKKVYKSRKEKKKDERDIKVQDAGSTDF